MMTENEALEILTRDDNDMRKGYFCINDFLAIEVAKEALKKTQREEWTLLTDDGESYPEPLEYVLVEDDIGDKNVACCYPDYDWYISNGENSLKLIGNIVKWKKLSN